MAEHTRTARVIRPDCQFGEHSWCKLEEVRVGRDVLFPAPRCDCSCHQKGARR